MTDREKTTKKERYKVKTFPVPFNLLDIKEIHTHTTDNLLSLSKEQIINKAFIFHSEGKILKAKKYYQHFLDMGFTDHRVFSNYIVLCKKNNQIEQAIELCHFSINIFPKIIDFKTKLATLYIDKNKLKEAKKICDNIIDSNPSLYLSYFILSSIFIKEKNFQEAENYLLKTIKLNDKYSPAYTNLANIFKRKGNLNVAKKYYIKSLEIDSKSEITHCNLGNIFRDLGDFKDAESSYLSAISINSRYGDAYFNLSNIYRILGKIDKAEAYIIKAIKYNSFSPKYYYLLTVINSNSTNNIWKKQLFSNRILCKTDAHQKVDIYFARSNVYHQQKKYNESAKCLQIANEINLRLKPSNMDELIKKSNQLMVESNIQPIKDKNKDSVMNKIFIVGMPRSGSTLLESILSMNVNAKDLGEANILEKAYLKYKKLCSSDKSLSLDELYSHQINIFRDKYNIIINKWLYNYQYTGIILSQINDARIIHCFRNPLDNIISIYRTNFASGNSYSSSINDIAQVYLNQDKIMTEYKKKYRPLIYDLNYDLLVSKPQEEIKSLINWLEWEWDSSYLTPQKNARSVSTASSVQVRSPINSKSIGGWKNYKDMLKPAIKILSKTNKFRNISP